MPLYSASQLDVHARSAQHAESCCSISSTHRPNHPAHQVPSNVVRHKVTIARYKFTNRIMIYIDCAPGGPEFEILGTETASGPLSRQDRLRLAAKYPTVEPETAEAKDDGEETKGSQDSTSISILTRSTSKGKTGEADLQGRPAVQRLNFLAQDDSVVETSTPPRRKRTSERHKTPFSSSTPFTRGTKRKRDADDNNELWTMSSPLSSVASQASDDAASPRSVPKSDRILRSRKL